ncbi:MAG: peptidoglycan DD-metalloendopeptidase family protein [Succinivibrio sp.]|nr:peptidoglycan DD-metalloendopeptidase family protein [Succinivibrio sp.]
MLPVWLCCSCFTSGCFANSDSHRVARVVDATQTGTSSAVARRTASSNYRAASQAPAQSSSQSAVHQPKPYNAVEPAPDETYVVKAGDTLYSIAFRFNQDYHQLAKQNGIEAPYSIYQGQVLKVGKSQTAAKAAPALSAAPAPKAPQIASNLPYAVPLEQARAEKEQAFKKGRKSLKYKVKTGDSVNSVARSYEVPLEDLVRANKLSAPYYLKRGSTIVIPLEHAERTHAQTVTNTAAATTTSSQVKAKQGKALSSTTIVTEHGATIHDQVIEQKEEVVSTKAVPVRIVRTKAQKVAGIYWQWPAAGKVIKTFSTAEHGSKGIDIRGNYAQDVMSAADGEVVYAGNALRGYGNLIIVNHANEYLSAYAHNEDLLVKEGQQVKRGQVIAKMGSTDADQVMLHFEVRHKGSSVDPQKFLP